MSSLSNVTLDDSSSAITYIGNWDGQLHKGDPLVGEYSNGTFHASNTTGDTATFTWNGGGIWFFGAFRANHGYFSIKLDEKEKEYFNGQADSDIFNQVIYANADLEVGNHRIVLVNEANYNTSNFELTWVDLDYIMVQADPAQFDQSSIPSESRILTTGTPRVQAILPPTGTTKPIMISSSRGGQDPDFSILTILSSIASLLYLLI